MRTPLLLICLAALVTVLPAQAQTPFQLGPSAAATSRHASTQVGTGQTTVTLAVADFEDISLDSGRIASVRLSEVLQVLLQRQAGGRLRVIAGEPVRVALRSQGYRPRDLISPTRAAEVARILGADWLVTGRWTHLRVVHTSTPDAPPAGRRSGDAFAYARIELQVFDASARRVIFRDSFTGQAHGGYLDSLLFAATEALHFAAIRIAGL